MVGPKINNFKLWNKSRWGNLISGLTSC